MPSEPFRHPSSRLVRHTIRGLMPEDEFERELAHFEELRTEPAGRATSVAVRRLRLHAAAALIASSSVASTMAPSVFDHFLFVSSTTRESST